MCEVCIWNSKKLCYQSLSTKMSGKFATITVSKGVVDLSFKHFMHTKDVCILKKMNRWKNKYNKTFTKKKRPYRRHQKHEKLYFVFAVNCIFILLKSDQSAITSSLRSCRPPVYLTKMRESPAKRLSRRHTK